MGDFVYGIVNLSLGEFRECFHRLCVMVNADDGLGMFLVATRHSDEFFAEMGASSWVELVWSSDEILNDGFGWLRELGPRRFGVFEVCKPVGEEFLIQEVFDISGIDSFYLVVTDEVDFPFAVREFFTNHCVYDGDVLLLNARFLQGENSFLYVPGNAGDDNESGDQYGLFETESERFIGLFPNSRDRYV